MQDNVNNVSALLNRCSAMFEAFPPGFAPTGEPLTDQPSYEIDDRVGREDLHAALKSRIANMPDGLYALFVETGAALARARGVFGGPSDAEVKLFIRKGASAADSRLLPLVNALMAARDPSAEINSELESSDRGFTGSAGRKSDVRQRVLLNEIDRYVRRKLTPFANTISTLLGSNALMWLAAESRTGDAKLQPHEYSRANLKDLETIGVQVAIEQELLELGAIEEQSAKMVVCLTWALASLASFIDTAVFMTESDLYVSSVRNHGLTMSYGPATETITAFDTDSMRSVISLLRAGLEDDLLLASDLMWMATGLSRIRLIHAGLAEPTPPTYERYAMFLSHRGPDAKSALSRELLAAGGANRVFLDCLALPHGVVNKRFVFESLALADETLIVDTPNFNESLWCRKEAWFADFLARQGLASYERVSLDTALVRSAVAATNTKPPNVFTESLEQSISTRIVRDNDEWSRTPNRFSLKEHGIDTGCLDSAAEFFSGNAAAVMNEDLVSASISAMLNAVLESDKKVQNAELWSTALQYAVAMISVDEKARSTVEIRQCVDQMNQVVAKLLAQVSDHLPNFSESAVTYMTMIASAVAIDMARFTLQQRTIAIIAPLLTDDIYLRDHTLLLDVRTAELDRDFRLRLALLLVDENIGSVGIVQSADDPVHESIVDGQPVSVLPCVTMYPGMESVLVDDL